MRRFTSLVFTVVLAITACGGGGTVDADPFATYPDCYAEHHVTEALTAAHTITICCLDHPIGSSSPNVVCGGTATSCTTYVTAQLAGTDATAADITAACTDYINQR